MKMKKKRPGLAHFFLKKNMVSKTLKNATAFCMPLCVFDKIVFDDIV